MLPRSIPRFLGGLAVVVYVRTDLERHASPSKGKADKHALVCYLMTAGPGARAVLFGSSLAKTIEAALWERGGWLLRVGLSRVLEKRSDYRAP